MGWEEIRLKVQAKGKERVVKGGKGITLSLGALESQQGLTQQAQSPVLWPTPHILQQPPWKVNPELRHHHQATGTGWALTEDLFRLEPKPPSLIFRGATFLGLGFLASGTRGLPLGFLRALGPKSGESKCDHAVQTPMREQNMGKSKYSPPKVFPLGWPKSAF